MPKLCWSMGLVGLARGLLLSNWPSRLFRVITSSTLMASQLITLIHWRAYPAPGDLSLSLWSSWSVILGPPTSRPIGWGECARVRERVAGEKFVSTFHLAKNQTLKSSLTSINFSTFTSSQFHACLHSQTNKSSQFRSLHTNWSSNISNGFLGYFYYMCYNLFT